VATDLIARLVRDREAREVAGLGRSRRTLSEARGPRVVVEGRELVAFASNDYLGLAAHPAVVAAARAGALRWGVGAGASHLVSGHVAPHALLEAELAAFVAPCPGARALTFSSGYLANLAVLSTLAGRRDAIFADRLNHASLNDGAVLSRAEFVRYPHGDVAALERRLAASSARRKVIATDAVFSMDGDIAPLPALAALAEAFDAWLAVDDAHGFGVLGGSETRGRGTLAHFGLASDRIVCMGTLGKAAGVAGAFVTAHAEVIAAMIATARPYVYTTAAPALLAEATRASLAIIRDDAPRHAHLARLIGRFRSRMRGLPWRVRDSSTPIQPIVVGGNAEAVALAEALWQRGFLVPAIRPPTVPEGEACLRISLSWAHTPEMIEQLVEALRETVGQAPRA
jgi:8-amino-7-oxononanoate synthase